MHCTYKAASGACCDVGGKATLKVRPSGAQTFDEMLLLKRGGSVIYNGPLGEQSGAMIAYFESIPGVQPIAKGYSEPLRADSRVSTCSHRILQVAVRSKDFTSPA